MTQALAMAGQQGRCTRAFAKAVASALTLALACAPALPQAAAGNELIAALNAARLSGCAGLPGAASALQENVQLNEAARQAATPMPQAQAISLSGYRDTRSGMLHIRSAADAATVSSQVTKNACANLLDPAFRDIGVFQRARDTWIVLATPFAPPAADAADGIAKRVLELVNQARAQARMCGETAYPAAGRVTLNDQLGAAALAHAADMAQHNYFSHDGRDGSNAGTRATRNAYKWRALGENLASGQTTPEAAVTGWLKSPAHCATLMSPQFTEMGLAYAVNQASRAGVYWVQVFATPR